MPSSSFPASLAKLRAFAPLRYREYRYLWVGQGFSTMGMWMDEVTRGWLIYELTDSAVQLGLVRGIQAIPFLVLSPFAGSAADRYSRKTQLVVAQSASVLLYALTAALIFAHAIQAWHVYVLALLVGTASVFQQPSRGSLISDSVPHEYLTNAIGLNSVIFNVSRSIGPALAGALIVIVGTGGAYAAQAALLLGATLMTVPLTPSAHAARKGPRESFARSIAEGWRFSWENEAVRAGLGTVMLTALFIVPFTTLLPVFARDLLQVGATGQGFMLTAMGLGALVSAWFLANAGHTLPRGLMMLVSAALYGVVIIVFGASHWYWLTLAAMFFAGMCHVNSNGLVQTVIQSYSPQEYRGRTMAIFSMNQALITIGAMGFGAMASLAGPRIGIVVLGIAGVLSVLALMRAMPQARHIR